jgi:hypothetical protein
MCKAPLNYLLMPVPNAPANLEVVSPTENSTPLSALIQIRWTASSGAASYRIERSTNISQGFTLYATSSTTTFNDTPPSGTPPASVQTYLYRVRALDSSSAASAPSNLAFATSISFTDPTITPHVTVIKGQHLRELRWAVDAVRRAAGLGDATWTDSTPEGVVIQADHIRKLREKLGEALTALSVPVAAYTDPTLYTGANGTFVKHEHFEELRDRSTRGSSANSGPNNGGGGNNTSSSTARLDPMNQTGGGGENPLSRNFNWSLPLVGLKGRAGLDLGLTLSYNSLVWTKSGNSISFDDDRGFPAPGFRLGFPVIQSAFSDEAGKSAFMLITPDGSHTELRQVGTSDLYEATDSSYLTWDIGTLTLRATDGTKLSYSLEGSDYKCIQIEDSNGNYRTINYTAAGQIDTIVDTLSRNLKFNYTNGYLTSITQDWKVDGQTQPVPHPWARFDYGTSDLPIQTDFPGLTVLGPQNGTNLKVLKQVKLADESHFDFDYTLWGQVWKVSSYAPDNHLLNYRSYNLPGSTLLATSSQTDCPRFTERRDWAENWNRSGSSTGASGLPSGTEQEVVTHYDAPDARSWTLTSGTGQTGLMAKVTMPDQSFQQIYYAGVAGTSSGWQRGLASLVETYDKDGGKQRWAETLWTQDDTTVSYQLNPRVSETNIYDPNNHKRTSVTYQTVSIGDGTSCNLTQDVYEYQANGTTVLRRTHTEYNLNTVYTSRHIIGLAGEKTLYEVDPNTSAETLMSKVAFAYDEANSIEGNDTPIQHDNTNYGASFAAGRGLLTSVKSYDVTNTSQSTVSSSKYNTAGAVVSTTDPLGHGVTISYADSFSDNTNHNTLAYPTMVTDPGGFKSYAKYNYDFGAVTWTQTPKPNVTNDQLGPEQTFEYDSLGRIQKVTNLFNNAYTRYVYSSSGIKVDTYATIQENAGEAHSFTITDGLGRVIAIASDHPNSNGDFSGQLVFYDAMGQVIKKSNPTETTADTTATPLNPSQWAATGDDSPSSGGAGWVYTQQAYDWKGRPTVTTNPDNTTKQLSYGGCGCAGGEVVTITDEVGRQQRVTSDILGRTKKTEVLNMDNPQTVYTTTVNTYNARDQITNTRQYQGTDASGVYQEGVITYDGYGRLLTGKAPDQTSSTSYTYYDDGTTHTVTDARGVTASFSYNSRRLVTGISYDRHGMTSVGTEKAEGATGTTPVADAPSVTYQYDAAGNRISMSTENSAGGSSTYTYNDLSRLTSEARQFPGLTGTFTLNYEYNLGGELKKVTDVAAGQSFTNTYNAIGQLTSVAGAGYTASEQTFVSGMQYRAWGALKGATYGNGTSLALSYNTRGLMTHYGVGGVTRDGTYGPAPHGSDYEYYGDGRVKFASDLFTDALIYDGRFKLHDRAYAFDQVGRLKEAYSGKEANIFKTGVESGADGAFRQTYSYSVWDEMTSRTGRFWSAADNDSETFDLRGRNTAWEYDADGRFISRNEAAPDTLPYEALRQSYDAAGRLSTTTQETSNRDEVNQNIIYTAQITRTESYDGDGVGVKQATTTQGSSGQPSTTTIYYLRSSVLGGQVIAELDAQGNRQRSYVFAGATAVATHYPNIGLLWKHVNPVTGDEVETDSQGVVTGKATLDTRGVNLGDGDPVTPPMGGSGNETGPSQAQMNERYAQLLPASMGGGGIRVKVDGMETSASFAFSLVAMGTAGIGPAQTVRWNPNVVGERGARGAYEFFHTFDNGHSGWMTSYGFSHYEGGESFYNSAYDDRWENKSWLTNSSDVAGNIGSDITQQNPTQEQAQQGWSENKCGIDFNGLSDAQVDILITVMHEATPAWGVATPGYPTAGGREWTGFDKPVPHRIGGTGPLIDSDRAFLEMQMMVGVIINAANYYHDGDIHATIFDPNYINAGTSKTPQQFYDEGIRNVNSALQSANDSPECRKLRNAVDAVSHPMRMPPAYRHWRGTSDKPYVLGPADIRVGFTDFLPFMFPKP